MNFKRIPDYPDYRISELGYVISFKGKKPRAMKNIIDNHGYYFVNLSDKNGRTKHKLVHRLVAQAYIDNPENKPIVDHINGDIKNNNLKNLRWCTNQENHMNQKKRKNTSSKYKGVTWDKKMNKWRAKIRINGKQKHLGYFDDEKEASEAYNKKSKEVFGEFHREIDYTEDD